MSPVLERSLDEFDVLVRHSEALPILRKVLRANELSFSKLVSPQKPFGLLSNFSKYTTKKISNDDHLFYGVSKGKRIEAWVSSSHISMNNHLVCTPKVLLPEARGKAADGVADSEEMAVIRKVADALGLDMDEIEKMREGVTLNLSTSLTSEEGLESLVGIKDGWSIDQKKKHIRAEFQKWSNRLSSLPEGDERDAAQNMLDNLSVLKKKYD